MVRDDDMPVAHLALAVEGASWTDPDNIPLMIASTIMGSWDRTQGGSMHHPSQIARVLIILLFILIVLRFLNIISV